MKIRATLVAFGMALVVAVCAPATADEVDPGARPVTTIPGYTGPAIFGLWPKTGDVATVLVYAPVDRRWGVERVARQWNKARTVRLVLVTTPCAGCITIRQTPPNEALGDATIYATDGVMQHCDIRVASTMQWWAIGRRSMIAHELGHCLGLAHTTRLYSAVGTMSGLDGPTWRDLDWIRRLYGAPSAW